MLDFYETFSDSAEADKEIPNEILDEVNKELPSNLVYLQDANGCYRVVPKSDCGITSVRLTTQYDIDPEKDAVLVERLQSIPHERWPEYFYRAQKCVAIKNIKIGNDEELIPLEQAMSNPLADEYVKITDCIMRPEGFPEASPMTFETDEGDKTVLFFQQQAYDSLTEIKFSNVGYPALKIDIYVYNPLTDVAEKEARTCIDKQVSATYTVTPTNAQTTSKALEALRIFKGMFTGTMKVNGQRVEPSAVKTTFDPQSIDDALHFWSTAKKLENKLKVQFDPREEFSMEDVKLFSELDACLNEGKQIIWEHPFEHFHVNGYHPRIENDKMDSVLGKDELYFQFFEGPIQCKLFGATFDIFSSSEMVDLVLTNIEWEDEEKQNGEIYVSDAPGKRWQLRRQYMTKEDAEKLRNA